MNARWLSWRGRNTQQVNLGRRMLQSDILFMKDEAFGWVEYQRRRGRGRQTGTRS